MLEIGKKALRLQLADGRQMTFARDDPQLRHLAYAYASTVHAAQGQTHERVIAVLDTGAGPLVNQQTLYVQLSRAREQAVVLTDNREQLVETLEANTGERLTALEAIGEAAETAAPVKTAVSVAADFLEELGAGRRAQRLAEEEAALAAAAETAARSEVAAGPDTPEIQAAGECRRLRAAVAQAGALIYQPGVEALGADATRLLATPGLSEGDRRFLESLKAVIDSETRVRDDIRDMIERARAHLREYPEILDRAPEPAPAKAGEPRRGPVARARRLFGAEESIPVRTVASAPRALNDVDPDYRKWDIRAELFVKTFRQWRALDNAAHHLDRRRIDIADLIAEFEAIRRAARDPQAAPHRIELSDAGAFAAADQRHDPDRLAVLLQAAIRPEEERDRDALVELARWNRAWPEETHAVFCNHIRDAIDADDERSLFRLEQHLPATLAGSFRNLSEECWRHRGEALMRQQELTREHGLSY